jgi:hypothetical protein
MRLHSLAEQRTACISVPQTTHGASTARSGMATMALLGRSLTLIMLPKPVSSSRVDLRGLSCQHVGFFDLSLL